MFAASSLSERPPEASLRPIRVNGGVRLSFRLRGEATALSDCEERDGYRVRFPRGGRGCEGVIINTGGGVAGGDRVLHAATLSEGCQATLSTQAAERIYRSSGDVASIDVKLTLAGDSALAWLPQETILFDRAALSRRFEIDMAASASLLIAEITVFGRKEMGEAVNSGRYRDRWRVRRGGKLAFAESIRLEGALADELKKPAIGNGERIAATLLYASPAAEDKLEKLRATIAHPVCRIAASAWNGLLCVRALGSDLEGVRRDFARAITALRGEPMPRVWQT